MKKLLLSLIIGTLSFNSLAQNLSNANLTITNKTNEWIFTPNANQALASISSEHDNLSSLWVFSNINFRDSNLNFTYKTIYLTIPKHDDLKCEICSLSIYKNNQEYKFNVLHTNNIPINSNFLNEKRQTENTINLAFTDKSKILKLLLTPGEFSINFNNSFYSFKPKNTISNILNNQHDFSNWNSFILNNQKYYSTQELTLLHNQIYGMELSIPIPNNPYGEPVASLTMDSVPTCHQCTVSAHIKNTNYTFKSIDVFFSKETNTSVLIFPLKDLVNIKKITEKNNIDIFSIELERVNLGKNTHYFNMSDFNYNK